MDAWQRQAVAKVEADYNRSSDTHLIKVDLPVFKDIHLYLKDESTHPTGSLKHRLARSLFLYGLCNGYIHKDTTIVEASSGNTAISEAYFARLLGLKFVAVIPKGTSKEKINEIVFYGGRCEEVRASKIYQEAANLAQRLNGHYLDQFTYAERATDWRGNNNIAESIFNQMREEPFPVPSWVVVSAGTGGTSTTIGRYLRYQQLDCRLCVADPEFSVFYDYYHHGDSKITSKQSSKIEGVGRPRVEPSFIKTVVDRMVKVPDAASIATIHFLEKILRRRCGGSTGTNLYAAFQIMSEMRMKGKSGSLVSMICDRGERYEDTYYQSRWLKEKGYDLELYFRQLEYFYESGRMDSNFVQGEDLPPTDSISPPSK